MTMAASAETVAEESLPEISGKRNSENELIDRKTRHNTRCSLPSDILIANVNETGKNESDNDLVKDVNSNGNEFSISTAVEEDDSNDNNNNGSCIFQEVDVPRVLNKSALSKKIFLTRIFPRRPLSLPVKEDSFVTDRVINRYSDVNHNQAIEDDSSHMKEESPSQKTKKESREKRKNFHQDVEEALNSLLWQPYEYQNKRSFSDSSSFSLSYTSCSSSLSSLDLEEYPNNGPSADRSGNVAADLHLAEEMVNNLSVDENSLVQWESAFRSRAPRTVAASRLSGSVGVSRSRSSTSARRFVSSCCDDVICDGFRRKSSEMRLEVPPQGSPEGPSAVHNASLLPSPIRSTSVSNLSSANVVGLPDRPRHASVPSNTTGVGKNSLPGFPYHPRNASEPGPVILPPTQYRNNNNHQRHSSHVDAVTAGGGGGGVLQPIVHLRSSSVPKSMASIQKPPCVENTNKPPPLVAMHQRMPSSTEIMNVGDVVNRQTRPPLNVSNVNVNFYRAVPVNVVSAVPTIQCVNSSNDASGNNVSNVHIMPLNGTSSQSTPVHVSSSVTLNSNSNIVSAAPVAPVASFSSGTTTQVAVHATQTPCCNVQVPSNSMQVPASGGSTNAQVQTVAAVVPPPRVNKSTQERTRTFTSTEAQTDDIAVCSSASTSDNSTNKEQRRRERRERRHQRRVNSGSHNHNGGGGNSSSETTPSYNCGNSNERLPDILNSHLPPPYSPLPGGGVAPPPPQVHGAVVPGGLVPAHHHVVPPPPPPGAMVQPLVPNVVPSAIVGNAILPFPPPVVAGQVPLVQGGGPVPVPVTAATGFRFPFPANGFRR